MKKGTIATLIGIVLGIALLATPTYGIQPYQGNLVELDCKCPNVSDSDCGCNELNLDAPCEWPELLNELRDCDSYYGEDAVCVYLTASITDPEENIYTADPEGRYFIIYSKEALQDWVTVDCPE